MFDPSRDQLYCGQYCVIINYFSSKFKMVQFIKFKSNDEKIIKFNFDLLSGCMGSSEDHQLDFNFDEIQSIDVHSSTLNLLIEWLKLHNDHDNDDEDDEMKPSWRSSDSKTESIDEQERKFLTNISCINLIDLFDSLKLKMFVSTSFNQEKNNNGESQQHSDADEPEDNEVGEPNTEGDDLDVVVVNDHYEVD